MPNIFTGHVVNHVENIEEKYPGKFAKFFMPPLPLQTLNPKSSEVEKILNDNPGLFQGYGEALEMWSAAARAFLVWRCFPINSFFGTGTSLR